MSSFIVDDKTINRIVTFLSWKGHEHRTDILGSELNQAMQKFGIVVSNEEQCEKLANSLLLLNKMAVDERYSETNLLQLMKFREEHTSIFQVLKSLHCLHYQCCEGDVPKEPLYKMLDKIISIVESHIIRRLPEYEQAEWG